jgi:hypothetical protein
MNIIKAFYDVVVEANGYMFEDFGNDYAVSFDVDTSILSEYKFSTKYKKQMAALRQQLGLAKFADITVTKYCALSMGEYRDDYIWCHHTSGKFSDAVFVKVSYKDSKHYSLTTYTAILNRWYNELPPICFKVVGENIPFQHFLGVALFHRMMPEKFYGQDESIVKESIAVFKLINY